MDRDKATALLDALHAAQNEFYGGGSDSELRRLIAPDIVWTVPGASPIARVRRHLAHRARVAIRARGT